MTGLKNDVLKYRIRKLWTERRIKHRFTKHSFRPNGYVLTLNAVMIRELIQELKKRGTK